MGGSCARSTSVDWRVHEERDVSRPLNPFNPSRPIDPNKFVGRHNEIKELEAALAHAKSDEPRHFLITGERGVGKTSFFDYLRRRATNSVNGGEFSFAVVDIAIHKQTTRLDFARALQAQLKDLLAQNPTHSETLGRIWGFIQRFEVAGVAYRERDPRDENHRDMYQDVADSLCEIVQRACLDSDDKPLSAACDGVLILVDEVDQASAELDIGTFFKYLLERLNRKGCHKVVVGLAGLSSATDVLLKSHASSLRVFDELALSNLGRSDVKELLDEAQFIVCERGVPDFKITESAREMLFELSDGHPHMLHQLGYCAFEVACGSRGESSESGFEITDSHVMSGFLASRGALDMLGDMYFRAPFANVEADNAALAVLDHMSETGELAAVEELAIHATVSVSDVERAVMELCRNGLLVERGAERFGIKHPAFAYWVKSRRPA